MTNPSSRLQFIDSIRGIAAFMVLFQHTYEHFFKETVGDVGKLYYNFGQTGVVAFFLVSGFIIPFSLEKSKSLLHFFVSRVFRIYPLYLLIIGIQFGLHAFGYVTEDYAVVPGKILLTHLFFAQEYIPLSSSWSINFVMGSWTLFIEAIWYVLMAGLFLFKVPHQRVMWISITGFAFIILTSYFLNIRFPLGRMGMLFNCILGLHLYRWSKKEISDAGFLTTLLPSLFLIFCGLGLAYWHFTSEHFTVNCVLASWSGAYLLFGLFYFLHNTGVAFLDSFLHYLGKISYSVYLAHFSVLILVEHYFGLTALAFGLTVSVTLLFSTGSYRWIEKPGIDLGKRLVK